MHRDPKIIRGLVFLIVSLFLSISFLLSQFVETCVAALADEAITLSGTPMAWVISITSAVLVVFGLFSMHAGRVAERASPPSAS